MAMDIHPGQGPSVSDGADAAFASLSAIVRAGADAKSPVAAMCASLISDPTFIEALPDLFRREDWKVLRRDLRAIRKAWSVLGPIFHDAQQQLEDELNPAPQSAPPEVMITVREAMVTDQAITILADRCKQLYDRGGSLVHIVMLDDMATIAPISPEWLRHHLSREISWIRVAKTPDGDLVRKACPPPNWVAHTILKMPERSMFPRLTGVATSPIIRKDGTIITTNGFDEPSGWLVRMPLELQVDVPAYPTDYDITAAMDSLLHVIRDFPFEEKYHRTAALAYLFSLVARTYYDGPTPVFMVTGTIRGAGKDMLVAAMTLIATGDEATTLKWPGPRDEAETVKMIHANYLAGYQALSWSNVDSGATFESAAFDKLLTEWTWTGRTLGMSQMVPVPNLAVWTITGNNILAGADLARRAIPCVLAPEQEVPEDRQLWDIRGYVTQNRGMLLSAVLTVIRGWIQAGAPKMVPDLGSFEGWSNIRSMLVWAGQPDPIEGQIKARSLDDASSEEIDMIIEGWQQAWGFERVSPTDILNRVRDGQSRDADNQFLNFIRSECLRSDNGNAATKLGRLLGAHRGRWHNNKRLMKGASSKMRYWQLERRESQPIPDLFSEPGEGG